MQDNDNVKALYRISVALNSQKKELEAWGYIKKAYRLCPNDKPITELYNTLKIVKDEHDRKRNEDSKQKDESNDNNAQDNNDSSEEDEKSKSLKSAFKFSSKNKSKPDEKKDDEVEIEEEKVPKGMNNKSSTTFLRIA